MTAAVILALVTSFVTAVTLVYVGTRRPTPRHRGGRR